MDHSCCTLQVLSTNLLFRETVEHHYETRGGERLVFVGEKHKVDNVLQSVLVVQSTLQQSGKHGSRMTDSCEAQSVCGLGGTDTGLHL